MSRTKILVIRFSSIGDIAWTSPLVRGLKEQLEGVELHFCTKRQYAALVEPNPNIDQVHYLEKSLNELIKSLKKEKFDLIIDLHKNVRSTILKLRLGVKSYTYKKYIWERFLLINFKWNRGPFQHWADIFWQTAAPLGVKDDGKGLDFYIRAEDEIKPEQIPPAFRNEYVALVIGASEYTKKLPLERLIELGEKIQEPLVLIGGPEDQAQGDKLVEALGEAKAWNSCGAFSIAQSASLVKQSKFVVGHDTGLSQIAAAFQKKIYAIFGSTLPQYLHPYRTPRVILENPNLKCRPCSKAGKSRCPKGHFKCMKEIEFPSEFKVGT